MAVLTKACFLMATIVFQDGTSTQVPVNVSHMDTYTVHYTQLINESLSKKIPYPKEYFDDQKCLQLASLSTKYITK